MQHNIRAGSIPMIGGSVQTFWLNFTSAIFTTIYRHITVSVKLRQEEHFHIKTYVYLSQYLALHDLRKLVAMMKRNLTRIPSVA
jgi:hypothetical protein